MIVFPDPKDPDDVDDFSVNWAARLVGAETVSTGSVTVLSGGGSVGSTTTSSPTVTARISGGTDGTPIVARWRITTSTGRQLDETATIYVQTR